MNAEKRRLEEIRSHGVPWQKWGPYVSDRQWGTVREDYSRDGDAWNFTTHDMGRSKAYRWGEEGIGGICDEDQYLCLALGLWNGRDSILKERFFGLSGEEGNHGEDVKELYYYLDCTPTHSYMKMLYKYPQDAFPYSALVEENRRRGKDAPEFEILDTGVFDDDRYFDVVLEYAKAAPEDILLTITARNRGPEAARITVLPQIWFRNTWAWGTRTQRPSMRAVRDDAVTIEHPPLGAPRHAYFDGPENLLFCENETNPGRFAGVQAGTSTFKDGINDFVVHGNTGAVNADRSGTKAAALFTRTLPPDGSCEIRVRLSDAEMNEPFAAFEHTLDQRRKEADEFFDDLQRGVAGADAKAVQRQAIAGMLWSKQFYCLDVLQWLTGDPGQPPPPAERWHGRNSRWTHLTNADVISMPDKWEYPWYAAWDLAFHCIPLAMVDPEFAKAQLVLLTREWYMHPNGQLPAYEWTFDGVNPPVHTWAAWRVYKIDQKLHNGKGDTEFLERIFHKLLLNFTWWVNKQDREGRNIFQGGFLGLDNIGVFDRSAPLPTGGHIEQADGTSWMAMCSLNLMRVALELALSKPIYQDMATKFFEHFMYIAGALANIGGKGITLWDPDDEFFYDVLRLPDGTHETLRVRSMIGLIPLFAVETLEPDLLARLPEFTRHLEWFLNHRPELAALVSRWHEPGLGERRLLSLLRGHRMKRLLKRMLDENEFLSPFGVRSLSRYHRDHPYEFHVNSSTFSVGYSQAESPTALFGGNSNWRGPIWFPVNYLIIESLQKFHHYYGNDFTIECPTGSGNYRTIEDVAVELSRRLTSLFLRDQNGQRRIFGKSDKLQNDPHFRDLILFSEYFDAETGRGAGASHQTGWTGLVAKLLQPRVSEPSEPVT